MLKSTPFFSSWSDTSISRLYFWFDRRKLGPEEDVVRQGDAADFCFIIKSGRCDVLVEVAEEASDSDAGGSTATSTEASPAFRRGEGVEGEEAKDGSMIKKMQKKKKQMLKMAAAAAFKGSHGDQDLKLRANMRHIVTLRPGAIVGEIALFKDGVSRMATVRSSENVELLILDRKSFLDLDKATLNIIAENARYNAACTKEPTQRTRDDLQILQQRTEHLSHLSSLSSDVHLELCRVMRYRKVNENSILVRKGMPAQCLYVLISGTAGIFVTEPRPARRWSTIATGKAQPLRRRNVSVDAFAGVKPTDTLRAGQAIGEDELLQEEPIFQFTAVTAEPVELMEIDRRDFDRILKADRTTERGQLIEFLTDLPVLEGTAVASIHALSNVVVKRSFMRDQLCFAHPPDQSLGSASFSSEHVYLIFSGEARILCGIDSHRAVPVIDPAGPPHGPSIDAPPPHNSRVERHMGNAIVPVATLGPGECITESLLQGPGARWCLRPITQLEILVIPRKDWQDTLRIGVISELRAIAADKAAFFRYHVDHIIAQTAQMHQLRKSLGKSGSSANASPRAGKRLGLASLATPVPRDAYAPVKAAKERGAGSVASPRETTTLPPITTPRGSVPASPRRDPTASPRGSPVYTPAIRTSRPSAIGMRPLIS
jgi:CRP-like cAMP-binding protein